MQKLRNLQSITAMACLLAIVFTLAVPAPVFAHKKNNDFSLSWDNVMKVRQGDMVIVKLFSGKTYQGKIQNVEPNQLAMTLGKKNKDSMIVPKAEIASVALYEKMKAFTIGGTVAAAGLLIAVVPNFVSTAKAASDCSAGQLSCLTDKTSHTGTEIAGIATAAAGVGIAALMAKPKYIYEGSQQVAPGGPAVAPGSPAK